MARCAPRVVAVDVIDAVAHDGGAVRVEPVDGNGVRRELPDEALFADLVCWSIVECGVCEKSVGECAKRTGELVCGIRVCVNQVWATRVSKATCVSQ